MLFLMSGDANTAEQSGNKTSRERERWKKDVKYKDEEKDGKSQRNRLKTDRYNNDRNSKRNMRKNA